MNEPTSTVRHLAPGTTVGLLMAATAIAYIDRASVAEAIGPASHEFAWTPIETGIVLSAFSWGYVLAMTPAGSLTDRLGAHRTITVGTLLWAVISLVTSAASSFAGFIACRLSLGAAESPVFPAAASLIATKLPVERRGRATALFDGGSYVGMAIGAPLVAVCIFWGGWRAAFIVAGIVCLIWAAVAILLFKFHREPRGLSSLTAVHEFWRLGLILRQPAIWWLSTAFFGYNFVKSFYLTWLAIYFTQALGIGTLTTGLALIFPPVLALLASISVGGITDRLVARRGQRVQSPGKFRGQINACAMVLAAIIVLVPETQSKWLQVVIISVAFAANIAASPGIWALPADLAPNREWIGIIGGVVNTVSNTAGIVAPIVVGVLVQLSAGSYTWAFYAAGIVALASAACFLAGGSYQQIQLDA